jgi:excisionase family DNA binding protein
MQATQDNQQFHLSDSAATGAHFAPQLILDSTSALGSQLPEAQRFLERQRAQALGHELPLNTKEAAAYVGLHPKTVERMARAGEIPAHPVSGVRRKTWKYYPSELDDWLRARVNSFGRPCSPNGKDTIQ